MRGGLRIRAVWCASRAQTIDSQSFEYGSNLTKNKRFFGVSQVIESKRPSESYSHQTALICTRKLPLTCAAGHNAGGSPTVERVHRPLSLSGLHPTVR